MKKQHTIYDIKNPIVRRVVIVAVTPLWFITLVGICAVGDGSG